MYQTKMFTASSPAEVERQANRWLQDMKEGIRLVQVAPTDVVQVSAERGFQRFTLVLIYEVVE